MHHIPRPTASIGTVQSALLCPFVFSPQEHGSNESPVEPYSAYPIGAAKDTLEVFIPSPHNSLCTESTASKLSLHFIQPLSHAQMDKECPLSMGSSGMCRCLCFADVAWAHPTEHPDAWPCPVLVKTKLSKCLFG